MSQSFDALASEEITLAEVEGLTATEAYAIADFGWTLLSQGRADAAAAIFETLTISNPRHAYFHALLGSARQRLGDSGGALAAYDRALELDPDETGALVNSAELLLADEACDTDRVVDLLGRTLSLDESGTRPETRRARALIAAIAAERLAPESDGLPVV